LPLQPCNHLKINVYMKNVKVGDLVNFFVVKAMPDYDAYLTCVKGGELLALLPKEYAGRKYLVGETGWAAVFDIKRGRVILSRKSPQFLRKMLEYLLRDFLNEYGIRIKKVSQVKGASFCKVAVETDLLQNELADTFKSNRPVELSDYISGTITLVKHSRDKEEYIVNALSPAPKEAIRKVIYLSGMKSATVYVEASTIGFFLGKRGLNVAAAAKLTGVEIEIKGV